MGVDIFVTYKGDVEKLSKTRRLDIPDLKLSMISNRGVKVWPHKMPETFCGDSWRCRFLSPTKGKPVSHEHIVALLKRMAEKGIDFNQIEHLCTFDGQAGYTLSQDEQ